MKVSGGKHDPKFSVEELAEVIRGKKHKEALGFESKKVEGEWMYRCADRVCWPEVSSPMVAEAITVKSC